MCVCVYVSVGDIIFFYKLYLFLQDGKYIFSPPFIIKFEKSCPRIVVSYYVVKMYSAAIKRIAQKIHLKFVILM